MSVEGDHRHCKVCGRVCKPGEETCSKACAAQRAEYQRNRRLYTYVFFAVAIFVALLFLSPYL